LIVFNFLKKELLLFNNLFITYCGGSLM